MSFGPVAESRGLAERLSAYAAGELDAAERREIAHLLGRSAEARAILGRLEDLSFAAAIPPAMPFGVRFHVAEAVESAARTRRSRRRFLGAVGLVAGAGVVAAITTKVRPRVALSPASPDHIVTGAGERQVLSVSERVIAALSERSEVFVVSDALLRLVRGSAQFVVRLQTGAPFVVRTPWADVRTTGGELHVVVSAADALVRVVRGEVDVRNASGARRAGANELVRVRPRESPRIEEPLRGLVSGGDRIDVRAARELRLSATP